MTEPRVSQTGSNILATKPLTIYKASAGAGKTFRLAVEYISLLVLNLESYRNILAVTFTNKATAEMKQRILSQLYGIANGLTSSDVYLDQVQHNTHKSVEEIRVRASSALSLLIHHYNEFRVQTIDAFFQTVLRNLAHELDLTANLRVSLNDKEIESLAVDEMIQELRPGSKVLSWIGEYIQSSLDENRSWNVFKSIKDFGCNIFEEFYHTHRKELNELLDTEGFFDHFVKNMKTMLSASLASIIDPYKKMLTLLSEEGLDDPQWFSGGASSGDIMYIRKMVNIGNISQSELVKIITAPIGKKRQERIDNPDKWISSKNKKIAECNRLVELARNCLCENFRDAEENRMKQSVPYISAMLTLAHLNQLRLLRAIEKSVDAQNGAANRFLLSNTQHLLHTMIDGSDTPFIFEKIGAQLRHIMIDEFQDTSTVQWKNFKVLLDNCLAQQGSHCLIVGDVKQSIYRWRSGDWRLLNDMRKNALTEIVPIKDNRRSTLDIVNFNNVFFKTAAQQETERLTNEGIEAASQLKMAYVDVEQIPHSEEVGRVDVLLLKQEGRSRGPYEQQQLKAVAEHVCALLDAGVEPTDIAILTRTNDDILAVADLFAHDSQLQERHARLVSDEAFRLDASISIRLIITALTVVAHPDDRLATACLVKDYQTYVLQSGLLESEMLVEDNLDKYLPDSFTKDREKLANKPLLDLIDTLYDIFSLRSVEGQTAYVCAFHDLLVKYLEDHTADIDELTKYWKETLSKQKVQSDDVDGVRILTIYKSKGLENEHVIVPFCDWQLEKGNTLWCQKPHPHPFGALPVVPVNFSATMLNSVYAEDYKEEHFQNIVDNLNVLYVAFTRAKKSLYVIGMKSAPANSRSNLVESVLRKIAENEPELTTLFDDETSLTFSYGKEIFTNEEEELTDGNEEDELQQKPIEINVFSQSPTPMLIDIENFKFKPNFRQSNRSRDFLGDAQMNLRCTYIERGNILHEIFSNIRTLDDVEPIIARLTIDGIIADNERELDDLRQQVEQCLSHPEARQWFEHKWKLYNECSILVKDENKGRVVEYRPDRVMSDGKQTIIVDFKFGHPRPEYQNQVKQYVDLLHEMGEKNVKGYLWYVTGGQVEHVV